MRVLYWAAAIAAVGVTVLVPTDESHASDKQLSTLELREQQLNEFGFTYQSPLMDTMMLREADLRQQQTASFSASGRHQQRYATRTGLRGRRLDVTSERIALHLGDDLDTKLVDAQSNNTRIEFDSAYNSSFATRTKDVQQVDAVHDQSGEADTETRLAGTDASYGVRSLEADLKLRLPFNVGDSGQLSPFIGAAGTISQESLIANADASTKQSASKDFITSRMLGVTVGVDYKQALSEQTMLDSSVDFSAFHSTSFLGSEANPNDMQAVAETAREQTTGLATRTRLKLGLSHQVSNDMAIGLFAGAEYWSGLATLVANDDASNLVQLGNDGTQFDYSLKLQGELRF